MFLHLLLCITHPDHPVNFTAISKKICSTRQEIGLGLPDKMAVSICSGKSSYFSDTKNISSKEDRKKKLGEKKDSK